MPTYYIRTDGNDANNGLANTPAGAWRNLSRVNSAPVTAGDTILVNDGIYSNPSGNGLTLWLNGVAGVSGNPITLKSLNQYGAKVVVPINTNGTNAGIYINRSFWTIEGFEIYGTHSATPPPNISLIGIDMFPASAGVTIRKNKIHDIGRTICSTSTFGFAGILVGQPTNLVQDLVIEENLIYAIGRLRVNEGGCAASVPLDHHDHGVYIDHSLNCQLRKNVIYDCTRGYAFHAYPGTNVGLKVYNNTFADASPTNFPPGQSILTNTLTNCEIKNNIFYQPTIAALDDLNLVATNVVVDHNMVTNQMWNGAVPSGVTITNTIVTANPGFVNSAARDYHLTAGSPARDAGVDVGLGDGPTPDLGAFQFVPTGATYYVATNGNDTTGNGSLATPWRTIPKGISMLNPGDTLYIRAGTWTEPLNLLAKTGQASAWITIAAYPGETVILRPTGAGGAVYGTRQTTSAYFVIDGFVFDGINAPWDTGLNIDNGAHDWVFQNLDVKQWHYSGFLLGNSINTPGNAIRITIRNCKIHDQFGEDIIGRRMYGLYLGLCDDCVIEGNEIYNNPGGGMQIYPGPSTNLIVRRNNIHHNNVLSQSNVGGILVWRSNGDITNCQIYNNLIWANGTPSSGLASGIELSNNVSGVKIWNNACYGNKNFGIDANPNTSNHEIRNNICFGNLQGEMLIESNTTTVTHNRTTNPLWVNPAAGNFHLQSASLAIDAGFNLFAQFTTDYDLVPRPTVAAWEQGPFEFQGGVVDTTPPAVPTGVYVR